MSKPTPDSDTVSIKPTGDLRVRKPNGQLLDPAGETVTWSSYWRRRELEGDIERSDPKEKAKPAKSAKPAPAATTPTPAE